jgi:hypothetical protein
MARRSSPGRGLETVDLGHGGSRRPGVVTSTRSVGQRPGGTEVEVLRLPPPHPPPFPCMASIFALLDPAHAGRFPCSRLTARPRAGSPRRTRVLPTNCAPPTSSAPGDHCGGGARMAAWDLGQGTSAAPGFEHVPASGTARAVEPGGPKCLRRIRAQLRPWRRSIPVRASPRNSRANGRDRLLGAAARNPHG